MIIKNIKNLFIKSSDKEKCSVKKRNPKEWSSMLYYYETALNTFGISITDELRVSINKVLSEHFDEITGENEKSLFAIYTETAESKVITNRLIDLIKFNLLNEKEIITFEKKVFSLKYYFDEKSVPFAVDLCSVLNEFIKNENYMNVIVKAGRLHSIEFAKLMEIYYSDKLNEQNPFEGKVSESFLKLIDAYGKNSKYVNIAWVHYIGFSSSLTCIMPNALLEYVTENNYKTLFNLLRNYCQNSKKYFLENYNEFATIICKKILNNICKDDVPALLLLGQLAENAGKFEKARVYYNKASNGHGSFNGVMSLINSYEKEIRFVLDAKYNTYLEEQREECDRVIRDINNILDGIYEKWEKILYEKNDKESASQYATLLTKHGRHEKDRKNYEKAYNLLSTSINKFPDSYRTYLEMGFIYQTSGSEVKPNKYYNPQKAIKMFNKALRLLKLEPDGSNKKRAKKSIMIPLAKTYYSLKKYDEAKDICCAVLSLDGHEKNAIKILEDIRNEENVA